MKVRSRIVTASMAVAVVTGLLAGFNEYATAETGGGSAQIARHWRGADAGFPNLRQLVSQLDLSDTQRTAIRQVLADARTAARADQKAAKPDPQALLAPNDPNHAAAVATAEQRASQQVQRRVATEAQIYALLTAEQRAKLPQLLEQGRKRRG